MGTWDHLTGLPFRDRRAEAAADKRAAEASRRRWAAHRARIREVDPALRKRMLDVLYDVMGRHGYIDITADATRDVRDLADDLAEAYERRVSASIPDNPRPTVACDDGCGAFEEPITLDEYKAALEHWRSHRSLDGCSHQR